MPLCQREFLGSFAQSGTLAPEAAGQFSGNILHQLPVTDLIPVRIVVRIIRIAIAAIAVGPVVLLIAGLLRSPVIRVVNRVYSANIIVEFVRRGAPLRATGPARSGVA